MLKDIKNYPEVGNIREDLSTLKSDAIDLAKHLKKDGEAHGKVLKNQMMDQIDDLQETGKDRLRLLEDQVRNKPVHAVAAAFAIGFIASILLKR